MNDGALNYDSSYNSTDNSSYKSDGEREYTLFMGVIKYVGILLLVAMMGQMNLMVFGIITLMAATINMVKWADPDEVEKVRR